MLKITLQDDAKNPTIKLEGKIVGPWVTELRRTWESLAPSLAARKLQLDLRGVGFVDAQGQQLLRDIYQQSHALFLADSPLTAYFVDLATQSCSYCGRQGA